MANSANKRRKYFIDRAFQARFILRFCTIVILSSLAIGGLILFFSMNSTTVAIENTRVVVKRTSDFILPVVMLTLLGVTLVSSVVLFLLTLLTSHKIAGPLYRIKKEIDLLTGGNLNVSFTVRDKDQLKDLAKSLSMMCLTMRQKHSELKERCDDLKGFLKDKNYCVGPQDSPEFSRRLEDVQAVLNYFKI
ncbi:MAG TPA: hypothetical protein PLF03_05945 [Candidatus Omnitrophota bacterium]|nr:hypothetical protein [Candidatus Omnitrophota bacterium]